MISPRNSPHASLILDRVPPNVRFEVDDIEEPWLFSRPFDYIHSRMMTSSISNWKQLVQRAYE